MRFSRLLVRIILACTEKSLDSCPLAGSSTTGIAANLNESWFLGIDKELEFAGMSNKRRDEIDNNWIYSEYRSKIKDIRKSELFEKNCFTCENEALDN